MLLLRNEYEKIKYHFNFLKKNLKNFKSDKYYLYTLKYFYF